MRAADFIFEYLATLGVSHVFTLTGGGAMHLNDALSKSKKIQAVFNLHEQAAGIAAEAYAQYKNGLGVCLTTTGPGATNAITACAAAWCDSTPVLFISGQVKTSDLKPLGMRQKGFQEIDIIEMVSPITKFAALVQNACDLKYLLSRATMEALNGRPGPVWLDIPLDVQAADIDFDKYSCASPVATEYMYSDIAEAVNLFKAAKKPIILAGNGVRLAGAVDDLLRLVDRGIPLMTTWKGIDFVEEDYPGFVGRPGTIAQRGANKLIQECDLLLAIGARLDYGQTGFNQKSFAKSAKKIVVDVDRNELSKYGFSVDCVINWPASIAIGAFLAADYYGKPSWSKYCRKVYLKYRNEQKNSTAYNVVNTISKITPRTAVIVPGSSGMASELTCQVWQTKEGQRFLNNQGLGSMGFGISAAIGACLASGRKPTICIEGDGSFAMNTQELETIRRLHLPIKIFVLNNGGYRSIRYTQENHFNRNYIGSNEESGLTLPSIEKIAKAYGIEYFEFEKDFKDSILTVFHGPQLIECIIGGDEVAYPRLMSKKLPNGTMVSPEFNELWPAEEQ